MEAAILAELELTLAEKTDVSSVIGELPIGKTSYTHKTIIICND